MSLENCIFCKIIEGEIPSIKIYDSDNIFAFMDINPLSEGHCLFIPKKHASAAHQIDDQSLSEILVIMKKVAKAMDLDNYNILQNNGEIAHQAVNHAHFHLIPKPNKNEGLSISWQPIDTADQEGIAETIIEKLKIN